MVNNNKSARISALEDISDEMRKNNIKKRVKNEDSYFVSSMNIDTKENRRLNAELGIKNINYFGNKNYNINKFKTIENDFE